MEKKFLSVCSLYIWKILKMKSCSEHRYYMMSFANFFENKFTFWSIPCLLGQGKQNYEQNNIRRLTLYFGV